MSMTAFTNTTYLIGGYIIYKCKNCFIITLDSQIQKIFFLFHHQIYDMTVGCVRHYWHPSEQMYLTCTVMEKSSYNILKGIE